MPRPDTPERPSSPPSPDAGFERLLEDFPWERPSQRWHRADPELAAELSRHIFDSLYLRRRVPLPTRQLIAVSALAALGHLEELRVHLWAALKCGVDRRTLTEAIFQIGTYAGLPATNQALAVLEEVLDAYPGGRQTSP